MEDVNTNQELTTETTPFSPIASGSNEDSDVANEESNSPWPPLDDNVRRSTSGSSSQGEASAEDSNLTVRKLPCTANNCAGNKLILPRVDSTEKIIICLDLSTDENCTQFRFGDGSKFSPFTMMQRIINIFLFSKKLLNAKHEYALVVLHDDKAALLHSFTNDPKDIVSLLSNLAAKQEQPELFDLSALFDTIHDEDIRLPNVDDPSKCIPEFVVRVILLYARSSCIPSFCDNKASYEMFKSSPYFFVDLLYIHEPVTDENKDTCEEIFRRLYSQVCNESSYVFNVARNPTKLHDCMSKLLAHPLQRPLQEDADYKLLADDV